MSARIFVISEPNISILIAKYTRYFGFGIFLFSLYGCRFYHKEKHQSFVNKTVKDGLGDNHVNGVFAVGSKVYAATSSGLSISVDGFIYGIFADDSNVYVATDGGLSISSNGGSTFQNSRDPLTSVPIQSVYASGTAIFLGTREGKFLISRDSGGSFTESSLTSNGSRNIFISKIVGSGTDLYLATDSGLFISTDSGTSFLNVGKAQGISQDYLAGVAFSGRNIYVFNAIYSHYVADLSISNDGGASFVIKTPEDGLGSDNIVDVYAIGSNVYVATTRGLSISTTGGL
ncbi:MAG: hypothetical protein NTX25_23495 [Proteobacteria bacterium]|nr:hypothetical protein [Pseudomonadota bacterium]